MESLMKLKCTANFTAVEIDLLVALVKKYKAFVECLKTDSVNAKMKKDAWLKIETEFNCQSSETYRTSAVLKNKYENIKCNVKKQYADDKTFSRGTGGGPAKSFPKTTISATVGELLQNKMTGEASVYDCDNEQLTQTNIGYISEDEGENIIILINFEDLPDASDNNGKLTTNEKVMCDIQSTSAQKIDWTSYTPADLKSRSTLTASSTTSDGNVSKKQKLYQDKITKWASTRASLSEQQNDAFIEQHKLKMSLMKEKHAYELKIMAEKHKIELENLKLQPEILQLKKDKEKSTQYILD